MAKSFQKALLLCPKKYSLYNSFIDILAEISVEVSGLDLRETVDSSYFKIQSQMFRFPNNLRNPWEKRLFRKINEVILEGIRVYEPDLVLVYNSEYLLPGTCEEIKKRSKLVFFMGDSPFFTPANNYYLTCLTYSDLILSPDTFWIGQLHALGINQTSFFVPGIESKSYYPVIDKNDLKDFEACEVIYAGASYKNSWGYKKALLMSKFTEFNFKLYGNGAWEKWFEFFPDLERVFNVSGYIPTESLNKMFNRAKIIPVDGNPGILNGFHIRLFEALGSGALPLIEYRKDVDELLFKDCGTEIPIIKDYNEAGDLAKYYLNNESERKQIAQNLREFIITEYSSTNNSEKLLSLLK